MVTKWLQLLKDVSPGVSRVALVFNPNSVPGGEATYRVPFEAAAHSLSVEPSVNLVHTRADLEKAFLAIAREPIGGVIIPPDLFTIAHHKLIIELAANQRLPTIYGLSLFTAEGGLVSYGPDPIDLHRRAVPYVDRILRGKNPLTCRFKLRPNSNSCLISRPPKRWAWISRQNCSPPPTR